MDYEKKYKDALELARDYYKANLKLYKADENAILEDIFPELKESEDERIKKTLIDYFQTYKEQEECGIKTFFGIPTDNILAWLEKQCEKKQLYIKHNKANIICKVISVNSGSYYVENIETSGRIELFNAEQNFHLWTIQDAKDGDVLAAQECYVIFKEIDGLNIKCYCTYHYLGLNPSFHINTLQNKTAFHPATKEQRDLLFSKMKEAGYEWDAKRKKLKKIGYLMEADCMIAEQKPWSEDDELVVEDAEEAVINYWHGQSQEDILDWLKSLKDRCNWKPGDEQIHAFEQVYDWYNDNFAPSETLTSLYNDLKKLKGE